ncbi:Phosphatidylinositol 4-kinase pik1alpha (PI4-kinase)(PtdIns-4-kinase), partial [Teratosphaeriaceae sp. CCFEE 6253]
MLEILKEDFDFDPERESNVQLLADLVSEKGKPKRRLFDTSDAARQAAMQARQMETPSDSVMEPSNGDLSSAALLHDIHGGSTGSSGSPGGMRATKEPPRLSSGV